MADNNKQQQADPPACAGPLESAKENREKTCGENREKTCGENREKTCGENREKTCGENREKICGENRKKTCESDVVLITGSSSGIGQALASQLLKSGCRVYGAARRYPASENWQKNDHGVVQIQLDVNDAAGCSQAVARLIEKEGHLDAVYFNAGYGIAGAVEETPAGQAASQMLTNVVGVSTFLPAVITQMRLQNRGSLVFIGSMAAVLPIPFQAYYSASKAALEALALALREEVSPYGIRCMVVQPGDTQTGFTQSREKLSVPENSVYRARFERSILKMERDEQLGMSAEQLARLILRKMKKKTLPPVYIPGLIYKTAVVLKKILPLRLVRFLIGRMYSR